MSLGPSVNMWVGDNGAGKTSVLEAVSILSFGRSFVSPRVKSVIAFDQQSLTVFGKVTRSCTDHRLAVQVSRNEERKLRVDGMAARGQGALSKILPVLQITPHVVDLVSGNPAIVVNLWIGVLFIGRMEIVRFLVVCEGQYCSAMQCLGVVYCPNKNYCRGSTRLRNMASLCMGGEGSL